MIPATLQTTRSHAHRRHSSRPCDPFDGYFDEHPGWDPGANGLLDTAVARRWMSVLAWGTKGGLYTFQQALEGKSGPRVLIDGREFLMISSYDYLGLIGHPEVENAAIEAVRRYGTGTGGVRLLSGTTALHRALERDIADFKGTEAALTFSSGYLANLGVITSLLGPDDRVLLDERAHRSIVDACKLARVPVVRFRHNDLTMLKALLARPPLGRRTLVIVEGVYSMDGDVCPLPELVRLKESHGAFLMVDEAHSLGVLGQTGRGIDEHFGVSASAVDLWTGSLSKAIPSNGGFVAARSDLIIYLQHGAGAFMFSAALCPAAVAAARASLRLLREEPGRLSRLHTNAVRLRGSLRALGYDTGGSVSPIIPVILGNDVDAYRLSRTLFAHGILANAVVSPAVPLRAARLRLCATAAQDEDLLDRVIGVFRQIRGNGHTPERESHDG